VSKNDKNLSPIARRAFFKKAGGAAIVGAIAGATLLGGGQGCASYSDYSDYSNSSSCGYCNGCGRSYYHCDGSYCNYGNYGDGC
jgi:hypothetical protein